MELDPRFERLLRDAEIEVKVHGPNFISAIPSHIVDSQVQTQQAFSEKWKKVQFGDEDFEKRVQSHRTWYLELFGFRTEDELAQYLRGCRVVIDAGAGKCDKAAWFAELSPSTTVIAADISDSLFEAVSYYGHLDNLLYVQCDIGNMPFFGNGVFDYVSCDQTIHHTADPYATFRELVRIADLDKDLAVYVYRKKALPRELLDEHFREYSRSLSHEEVTSLSEQLTDLGKILDSFDQEVIFPDIPLLNIEGGKMSVQRFIYWNFIKCFWNAELGYKNSVIRNFDWYAPSQAFRYSEEEFRRWIQAEDLAEVYFHREEACYSGRFRKTK